jgi:hypothetical protein
MTEEKKTRWYKIFSYPIFSPTGFCLRAGLIALIYGILHLAGLREYTVILSGNSPTDNPANTLASSLGCIYIFFYFAFTFLVPILLIAALIFTGLNFLLRKTRRNHGPCPDRVIS